MVLKWGICAAGRISFDFVNALHLLKENNQAVAVAARDLPRAQDFANKFDIPQAYGSYEDLANDPNIDAIYVGTIIKEHHKAVLLFTKHKKHVLCEKALGLNVNEVKEMIQSAENNGVFLMEAIWSRMTPAYELIKNEISKGSIGNVVKVHTQFDMLANTNEQFISKDLCSSPLLQIGIYQLQFALWTMFDKPTKCHASGTLSPTGVDEAANITLHFPGRRLACLSYGINVNGSTAAEVYGDKGKIEIKSNFWCPTEVIINGETHHFSIPESRYPFNFPNEGGLVHEIDHVQKCIAQGKTQSDLLPLNDSLLLMEIMEDILRQIGARE